MSKYFGTGTGKCSSFFRHHYYCCGNDNGGGTIRTYSMVQYHTSGTQHHDGEEEDDGGRTEMGINYGTDCHTFNLINKVSQMRGSPKQKRTKNIIIIITVQYWP